jgi:hypothetical protein
MQLFHSNRGRHVSDTRKGRERGISDVLVAATVAAILALALTLSGAEGEEFHEWYKTIRELFFLL